MHFYKNKRLIYALVFFHNLIPAYTIERLFWQEHGMNIQMVVWCEIIYAVTIVCLEFPSGLLADRFGRKKLLVIGAFFSVSEFIILPFAYSFWQFALAVFLASFNTAFTSGSLNALLYDSLANENSSGEFEKTLGKINAIDYTASIIAALSGGIMAAIFGMNLNYYISIASLTIAIFITFKLREPPQLITPENLPTLKTIVETTVKFLKSHLGLLRVLLNVVVVAACVSYIYEFWQLYLEAFAFPVAFFGLVSACLSVAVIPASLASGWLLKRFGHKQIVLFASFVCGGGILFAATVQNILGIAGLMLACASNAVISPVAFGYLHRFADDNARATIESSVSLGERVISIVLGLVFGYISNIYNVNSGFYFIGGLIILTSVFLTFSYKNK